MRTPTARPVTRLIVLPLRVLRPDSETDFLAFSLPDAIATSLSGLDSLVVRSSFVAAKFSVEAPDLAEIAAQADVDIVLVGTLLRAGQGLRVSLQLLEAPGGTVLWSQQTQVSLGDLFQLQDEVAQRIVESLASPLVAQERSQAHRDTPATAQAYEYYLRGNQAEGEGTPVAPGCNGVATGTRFLPTLCRGRPGVRTSLGTARSGVPADGEVFSDGSTGPSNRR